MVDGAGGGSGVLAGVTVEARKMRGPRDLRESAPEKLEGDQVLSKQLIGAYGEKAVEAQLLRNGWATANINSSFKECRRIRYLRA
jgi:hypothetical protein